MNPTTTELQFDANMRQIRREFMRRRRYSLSCWLAVKYGLASRWEPRAGSGRGQPECYDDLRLMAIVERKRKAKP